VRCVRPPRECQEWPRGPPEATPSGLLPIGKGVLNINPLERSLHVLQLSVCSDTLGPLLLRWKAGLNERRIDAGRALAGGRSLSSEFNAMPSVLNDFQMIHMVEKRLKNKTVALECRGKARGRDENIHLGSLLVRSWRVVESLRAYTATLHHLFERTGLSLPVHAGLGVKGAQPASRHGLWALKWVCQDAAHSLAPYAS
jgi:hypothetical protein